MLFSLCLSSRPTLLDLGKEFHCHSVVTVHSIAKDQKSCKRFQRMKGFNVYVQPLCTSNLSIFILLLPSKRCARTRSTSDHTTSHNVILIFLRHCSGLLFYFWRSLDTTSTPSDIARWNYNRSRRQWPLSEVRLTDIASSSPWSNSTILAKLHSPAWNL